MESVPHQQLEFGPEFQETGDDLPDHLKELNDRSVEGLSYRQRPQLLEILSEFRDIFSRGSQDLERTGLAKHEIDKGAAAPLHPPPPREDYYWHNANKPVKLLRRCISKE